MSPPSVRAASRFFRRYAGVRRRRARIDARHRHAPASRRAVRRIAAARRMERGIDDRSGRIDSVVFLFHTAASPFESRTRRRPIFDSTGAMHIFSVRTENSGPIGGKNAKIANLWQSDSRPIRRCESDSCRENFPARAFFDSRSSRRLRGARPRAIDVASRIVAAAAPPPSVVVGLDLRRGNGEAMDGDAARRPFPALSGSRRGLQSPAKPRIFRPQTAYAVRDPPSSAFWRVAGVAQG